MGLILSKHGGRAIDSREPRYRSLSLFDLISEIVENNDLQALSEFHNNRRIFSYNNTRLVLVEFLNELRESVIRGGSSSRNTLDVADRSFDLTLAKFSNLPLPPNPAHSIKKNNSDELTRRGPNACLYFKAFLKRCEKSFNKKPLKGEIEREIRAGELLMGLVRRQFSFSIIDAERELLNPFRSRYNLKVDGGTITLYLPVAIKGLERRKWLEEHVEVENVKPSGEKRECIQALINRNYANQRMVALREAQNVPDKSIHWPDDGSRPPSLAEVVAEEKAHNIEKQRPAIRALGKETLKQLILRIFDGIVDTHYSDGKVAEDFGLSRGTLSRFAGSHWGKKEGNPPPDLWKNMGQVLLKNCHFEELARTFQKQIQGTLERDKRRK